MKYFCTYVVPTEANSPEDALDLGFEKLLDPDGPAEGLIEHVGTEAPALSNNLIV